MPEAVGVRWSVVATAAVAVALVGAGVWLVTDGGAIDPGPSDGLDSCTTITEPGRYELAADITDSDASTCLRIRSSDVVVAGGGHRIDGVGSFGSAGVVVEPESDRPLRNVTVRDVRVTDWDDGIRYIRVVDGRVVRTTTADNRVGLSLLDTHDSRIADNVARANRLRGISLLESSQNNTLRNNTAENNALFGIHLVEGGVRDNTLASNAATNNEFGIVLIGVHDNAVTGNTARANRIAGIWLSASSGNRLARNVVSNRFYGIFLADRSTENAVTNNAVESNAVGIRLRSSDDNTVANNTVSSSSDSAILLISSDDNAVTDNAGTDNARGVTVVRSTGTVRANNTVSRS